MGNIQSTLSKRNVKTCFHQIGTTNYFKFKVKKGRSLVAFVVWSIQESGVDLPAHLYGNERSLKGRPSASGPNLLHLDSIASAPADSNGFLIGNC